MTAEACDLDAVAEGLWLRLRDVLMAERRLERFEFSPEAPGGAAYRLATLAADPQVRLGLALDMTLRSLAALADPTSFRILGALRSGQPVPLTDVARQAGLGEVAAAERVHALAQVGLASRDVERNCAMETAAGRGLVLLAEGLAAEVAARLERQMPALLSP